jgi:hypothetical protein
MRSSIRSPLHSPMRTALHIGRGISLPQEGLVFRTIKNPVTGQPTDYRIPLVTDKALVRADLWALLFDELDEPYNAATRVINIEASEYLNCGWELVGDKIKGYALYAEGTVMRKVYRYFSKSYFRYMSTSHYTNMEHYT